MPETLLPPPVPAPAHPSHPTARRRALRAIAVFEAVKGFAALAAGIGLLGLLSHDLHQLALDLLWRFHLDPAERYPTLLLHYADLLSALNLRTLAPLAVGYITIRLAEAWGLWWEKIWAEWLGALSGALYIPLEVAHLMHRTTWINATVLAANVFMVIFLAFQLWHRIHLQRRKDAAAAPGPLPAHKSVKPADKPDSVHRVTLR